MENKDSKGIVKEVNECVGDKVEKNGRKMSVKNSAMTRRSWVGCGRTWEDKRTRRETVHRGDAS